MLKTHQKLSCKLRTNINVEKPSFVSIQVRSLSEQETMGVPHVYLIHPRVINIIPEIDGNGRSAKVKPWS
jgi:hypothetical protein